MFDMHKLTNLSYAPATGAVPSIAVKLLLGVQLALPISLNVPPVGDVATRVEYFVRVLIPQAVTCEQSHLVSGYNSVPSPIEM
jgi:hypothetical protein